MFDDVFLSFCRGRMVELRQGLILTLMEECDQRVKAYLGSPVFSKVAHVRSSPWQGWRAVLRIPAPETVSVLIVQNLRIRCMWRPGLFCRIAEARLLDNNTGLAIRKVL